MRQFKIIFIRIKYQKLVFEIFLDDNMIRSYSRIKHQKLVFKVFLDVIIRLDSIHTNRLSFAQIL